MLALRECFWGTWPVIPCGNVTVVTVLAIDVTNAPATLAPSVCYQTKNDVFTVTV